MSKSKKITNRILRIPVKISRHAIERVAERGEEFTLEDDPCVNFTFSRASSFLKEAAKLGVPCYAVDGVHICRPPDIFIGYHEWILVLAPPKRYKDSKYWKCVTAYKADFEEM